MKMSKRCGEDSAVNVKKAKTFDINYFRAQLHSSESLKLLRDFSNTAENDQDGQDVALEYLESGGSIKELLTILDITAQGDLTAAQPVFRAISSVLIKIQNSARHLLNETRESIQYLLNTFVPTIQAMIRLNNLKHRKTVFRLLATIVALQPNFGRDILEWLSLSPSQIEDLCAIGPSRKPFILFIMSFFVEAHVPLIRQVVEKKDLVGCIIPGLIYDEAETVVVVLTVFKEKFLGNSGIHKTLKLKLFNTQIIQKLLTLYDWKGPTGAKIDLPNEKRKKMKKKIFIVNEDEKSMVVNALQSFLLTLCASRKHGVIFHDKTFGTSGKMHNQLIFTAMESLTKPWENELTAELVVNILKINPDLVKPTLNRLESSFEARDSQQWVKAVEFVTKIIECQSPELILSIALENLTLNQVQGIIRSLCLPNSVLKHVNVNSSNSLTIKFHWFPLLITLTKKLNEFLDWVLKYFLNREQKQVTHLRQNIIHTLSSHLPTAEVLLDFWMIAKHGLPESTETLFIPSLDIFLETVSELMLAMAHLDVQLLHTSRSLCAELLENLNDLPNQATQEKILQLITYIEPTLLVPDSKLFENVFTISLNLGNYNNNNSFEPVIQIFKNSGCFQTHFREIDCWIHCWLSVPESQRQLVAKLYAETLKSCYLSEYDNKMESDELHAINVISLFNEWEKSKSRNITCYNKLNDIQLTNFFPTFLQLVENYWKNYKKEEKKMILQFTSRVGVKLLHYSFNNKQLKELCEHYGKVFNLNVHYEQTELEKNVSNWILTDEEMKLETNNTFELLSMFDFALYNLSEALNAAKEDKIARCVKIVQFLFDTSGRKDNILFKKILQIFFGNKHIIEGFKKNEKCFKILNDMIVIIKTHGKNDIGDLKDILLKPWSDSFIEFLMSAPKVESLLITNWMDFFQLENKKLIPVLKAFLDNSERIFKSNKQMEILYCLLCKISEDVGFKKFEAICENFVGNLMKHNSMKSLHIKCFTLIIELFPACVSKEHVEWFVEKLATSDEHINEIVHCGQILLQIPNQIEHFLSNLTMNSENPAIILPIIEAIIKTNEERSDFDKIHKLFWTESELMSIRIKKSQVGDQNRTKIGRIVISKLELFYKKFRNMILQFIVKFQHEDLFINYPKVLSLLFELFLDESDVKNVMREKNKLLIHPLAVAALLKKVSDEEGKLKIFKKLLNPPNDSYWAIIEQVIAKCYQNVPFSEQYFTSTEFLDLTKKILRLCLNQSGDIARLRILKYLLEILVKNFKLIDLTKNIFYMVVSHSEFLNVIIGNFPLKAEVVEMLNLLSEKCPEVLTESMVPIIFAAYSASLSKCDQFLLKMLQQCEERDGINFKKFEPFFWGDAAVSHYSVQGQIGLSLWRQANMKQVMENFDINRVKATMSNFPVERALKDSNLLSGNSDIYDPSFFLPLFSNLLSPGAVVYCSTFIHKGGLSLTIMALSSLDSDVRGLAATILSRFYSHLQLIQHSKQRPIWLHFLDSLRYGLTGLEKSPVANLSTMFVARMIFELSDPQSPLYGSLQKYLLAKPALHLNCVPEFLPLFYNSDTTYQKHRAWILEILRDGVKSNVDVNLIINGPAYKVILCYYTSSLSNNDAKSMILQILAKVMTTSGAYHLLVEGLLAWISCICKTLNEACVHNYIQLMAQVIDVFKRHKGTSNYGNVAWLACVFNTMSDLLMYINEKTPLTSVTLFLENFLNLLLLLVQHRNTLCHQQDVLDQFLRISDMLNCRLDCLKINSTFINKNNQTENMTQSYLTKIIFTYKNCLNPET